MWSRKVVAWAVHREESMDHAATLIALAATAEGIEVDDLVLHSDNGGRMKGATMLATLQKLGILPSFSGPGVSNDNPFSESLFRTMKYRPEYPSGSFDTVVEAAAWVAAFVDWYNTEHLHSALRFVTSEQRHSGAEESILAARRRVYETAQARRPDRWSGDTRNWTPVGPTVLNPDAPPIGALAAA